MDGFTHLSSNNPVIIFLATFLATSDNLKSFGKFPCSFWELIWSSRTSLGSLNLKVLPPCFLSHSGHRGTSLGDSNSIPHFKHFIASLIGVHIRFVFGRIFTGNLFTTIRTRNFLPRMLKTFFAILFLIIWLLTKITMCYLFFLSTDTTSTRSNTDISDNTDKKK